MTKTATINQLSVSGFRSIKELDRLELKPLNLLLGPNGSGKSNLIEVFSLISQLGSGRLQRYVAEKGGAETLLHFGHQITPKIKIKVDFPPNTYTCVLAPDEEDNLYFETEEDTFHNPKIYQNPYGEGLGGGHRESHLNHEIWSTNVSRKIVERMRGWKIFHFHDTSPSAPLRKPSSVEDNLSLHENGANLASVLYRLRDSDRAKYSQLREIVKFAAPFLDDFVLKPQGSRDETISLRWKHVDSARTFGVGTLSDGTLRFIALATLLNQADQPDVIIMDEPELGLHPAAIGLLSEMMISTSKERQIIVATQSVTLVDQFSADSIIVADRENNASVFRRLEVDALSAWLEEYGVGELWLKNILGGRP